MIRQLLVLGASRDLAGRSLLPALARLHEPGRLPEPVMVVGVARDDCVTAAFAARSTGSSNDEGGAGEQARGGSSAARLVCREGPG